MVMLPPPAKRLISRLGRASFRPLCQRELGGGGKLRRACCALRARPPPVSVERERAAGAAAVGAGGFSTGPYDASQIGEVEQNRSGQQSIRCSSSAARPLDVMELLARRLRRRLEVAEPAVMVLWDSVCRGPPSPHGRPGTVRLVH
jgi:hypothetical protein